MKENNTDDFNGKRNDSKVEKNEQSEDSKNESENLERKGSNIPYIISIGAILVLLFAVVYFNSNGSMSANVINANGVNDNSRSSGDIQVVKLKVEGGSYVLNPSSFKKGIPVRIEAEMSTLVGCSRGIVIPAFNVKKSLNDRDNIIEFIPDRAGTFNIACSMNMYKGTFTVLDSDGTKGSYVEPASTSGGGCNMGTNGGGCGCGG